ncbi:hypothetical protein V6Z12_D01G090000 [Gossypium hirsutum]
MAMASEKLLVQCLVATLLLIAACKPAVTGENPPPPTKECCSLIKQADLTCLCNYKDALPAFQIEPSRAFALPQKCKCKHAVPPQCKP